MSLEQPTLPADNELPLRVEVSEPKAEGGDADIWKVIAKDREGQDRLVALKQARRQEFASDEAMKESKDFYDFLKTFPGFGRFVPDALYFKARLSPESPPRAYVLQPFLEGKSVDRLSDKELYQDSAVVEQLVELGENAIALLREARKEKRLRPDFTKSFDENRYANIAGNYLFNPRYSNNIIVTEQPDAHARRVFFVDTGANAEDRLSQKRAVVQREVATRLQGLQLRRWVSKMQRILKAKKAESAAG